MKQTPTKKLSKDQVVIQLDKTIASKESPEKHHDTDINNHKNGKKRHFKDISKPQDVVLNLDKTKNNDFKLSKSPQPDLKRQKTSASDTGSNPLTISIKPESTEQATGNAKISITLSPTQVRLKSGNDGKLHTQGTQPGTNSLISLDLKSIYGHGQKNGQQEIDDDVETNGACSLSGNKKE